MWLKATHIMDPTERSVNLSKTKNTTEGDKINAIMPTICHPVDLILIHVPKICGMKLCKYFSIPIIPKTHDISQLESVTCFYGSSKLISILQLIEINILHLADFAPRLCHDGCGREVGVEHIRKSIINPQWLICSIGINLSGITSSLPTGANLAYTIGVT
jgi:hypothetical protein